MNTGKQASELLDIWSGDDEGLTFARLGAARRFGDLFEAAPGLAATLAWLYGREADDEAVWDDHYEVSVTADKRVAVFDHDATTTYFTPDEAIEFARALIAAAEQARHE